MNGNLLALSTVGALALGAVVSARGSRDTDSTQTTAFRAWFGKSIVRDGKVPRVVWHGTRAVFDAFRDEPFGIHVGTHDAAETRLLHHAGKHPEERALPMRYLALYARIERPIRLKDPSMWTAYKLYDALRYGPLAGRGDIPFPGGLSQWLHTPVVERDYLARLVAYLEGIGYDGVVYKNLHEDPGSTSYVVFHPNQVKSVDAASFDRDDPRISANQRDRKPS